MTTEPGALDAFFQPIVDAFASVLFFKVAGFDFIVLWLMIAAVFFTFRLGFLNVRLFGHAIDVARGLYDKDKASGEVSPLSALLSALAGTVGLGSIAGVSVAVALGGPGAVFWIVVGGFFAMSSKYAEVTLSVMYRKVGEDGKIFGGPFQYLRGGLAELGMARLGKILAVLFAFFCLGGATGGGNMFQSNQAVKIMTGTFAPLAGLEWVVSLAFVTLVAMVVIGSIKRVAKVADYVTPLKGFLYIGSCLVILGFNASALPSALSLILQEAFSGQAAAGGVIGMLALSFKRAFFANEAGLGSAPIAHAAARVDEPVREGTLALLEPFFAALIGLMTGLVVTVTGAYQGGTVADGVMIASKAFGTVAPWFTILLAANVLIFAYSTVIAWSYYGEMAWTYLFGRKAIRLYQFLFCAATFSGGVMHFGVVLDFSDLLILGMALPNLVAVYLLTPKLVAETKRYLTKLREGEFIGSQKKQ